MEKGDWKLERHLAGTDISALTRPFNFGVLEGNRTPDLSLRRGALYPTELQTHIFLFYTINCVLARYNIYFLCVFVL
jgi:hypothetical protein